MATTDEPTDEQIEEQLAVLTLIASAKTRAAFRAITDTIPSALIEAAFTSLCKYGANEKPPRHIRHNISHYADDLDDGTIWDYHDFRAKAAALLSGS
jgi:hypothetical protein